MAENLRREALTYVGVYAALLLLLALTVWLAFIRMGLWNPVAALAIATLKAGLVALFYMHLRNSAGIVRMTAAAALIWLSLLFGLSLADYATRPGPGVFVGDDTGWRRN